MLKFQEKGKWKVANKSDNSRFRNEVQKDFKAFGMKKNKQFFK